MISLWTNFRRGFVLGLCDTAPVTLLNAYVRYLSMFRRILVFAACVILQPSWVQAESSLDERKEMIESMENGATSAAVERKSRSEALLLREGVPVNTYLPPIEDVSAVTRRSREEIAWRAMALLVVAIKGEGLEQPVVTKIVDEYRLRAHFTPKELAFIQDSSPTEHERVQFLWRYEAAWTLLWALGYVESLNKPTAICNVKFAVGILRERSSAQFISDAKLRPIESVLDEADLIYRYHWAVVDARIKAEPAPVALEPDVIMERHYALNWLIGYMDQDWDEISTDT